MLLRSKEKHEGISSWSFVPEDIRNRTGSVAIWLYRCCAVPLHWVQVPSEGKLPHNQHRICCLRVKLIFTSWQHLKHKLYTSKESWKCSRSNVCKYENSSLLCHIDDSHTLRRYIQFFFRKWMDPIRISRFYTSHRSISYNIR